jgi:hypothetical protein
VLRFGHDQKPEDRSSTLLDREDSVNGSVWVAGDPGQDAEQRVAAKVLAPAQMGGVGIAPDFQFPSGSEGEVKRG